MTTVNGSDLYRAGVSYYQHGTIKNGRKVTAYFFKLCAPATPDQLATLRAKFPHMWTGKSASEYAPELSRSVLVFPTKAQLKREGKTV